MNVELSKAMETSALTSVLSHLFAWSIGYFVYRLSFDRPKRDRRVPPEGGKELHVSFSPSETMPERFNPLLMCRKLRLHEVPDPVHMIGPERQSFEFGCELIPGKFQVPLSTRQAPQLTTNRTQSMDNQQLDSDEKCTYFIVEIEGKPIPKACTIKAEIFQQELQSMELSFNVGFRVRNISSALRDLQHVLKQRRELDARIRNLKLALWSIVFALLSLVETLFFPRVLLSSVRLRKISHFGFFFPWFLGSPSLQTCMAPHFSGWMVLFGVLPLPFFYLQLPAVLVPFLESGHLGEFSQHKTNPSRLPKSSLSEKDTSAADAAAGAKPNLLARIDVTRVPVQLLSSRVLQMCASWDVSASGTVLYPEQTHVVFNLPDHSRAAISIDPPRRHSSFEVCARGGYVCGEGEAESGRDSLRKMFITFDRLAIDGQCLFSQHMMPAASTDPHTDRGAVPQANTLTLEHHLVPIWACGADVINWIALLSHHTTDEGEVAARFHAVCRGDRPPDDDDACDQESSGLHETVNDFLAKTLAAASQQFTQHEGLLRRVSESDALASLVNDASSLDRLLADLGLSGDAFDATIELTAFVLAIDKSREVRGGRSDADETAADVEDRSDLRGALRACVRQRLLRYLVGCKRARVVELLRTFQISADLETCPDFKFVVQPKQDGVERNPSDGRDGRGRDGGVTASALPASTEEGEGAERGSVCFPEVRITYERSDMTGGLEVVSQMRAVCVGRLQLVTPKLWQLGSGKRNNVLRIPHALGLQLCLHDVMARAVLDDAVTKFELVTEPATLELKGHTEDDLRGFNAGKGVVWRVGSTSGAGSAQAPDTLRFEVLGVTPVTSGMEIPELEVMAAYGVPVETRVSGELRCEVVAHCGHRRDVGTPELQTKSGGAEARSGSGWVRTGEVINLVSLESSGMKLFLSRAEVSYGRRVLYLDADGIAVGSPPPLFAHIQTRWRERFASGTTPDDATDGPAESGKHSHAGKQPTVEVRVVEADISDGAALLESVSPVSPMRLQLRWNLRKGPWREPTDYSELLLVGESCEERDLQHLNHLRTAQRAADNFGFADAVCKAVFGGDGTADHDGTGLRRVASRKSHGSTISLADAHGDDDDDDDDDENDALVVSFPEDASSGDDDPAAIERFWSTTENRSVQGGNANKRMNDAGQNFLRTALGRGGLDRRGGDEKKRVGVQELESFAERAEIEAMHSMRRSSAVGMQTAAPRLSSPEKHDQHTPDLPRSHVGGVLVYDAKQDLAVNVMPQFVLEGEAEVAITSAGKVCLNGLQPWLMQRPSEDSDQDEDEREQAIAAMTAHVHGGSEAKRGVREDLLPCCSEPQRLRLALEMLAADDDHKSLDALQNAGPGANLVLSTLYDFAWGCPVRFGYLALVKKSLIQRLLDRTESSDAKPPLLLHLPYPVLSRWIERDGLIAGAMAALAVLGSKDLFDMARGGLGHVTRLVRIAEQMQIQQPADVIPLDRLSTFAFNALFSPDGELLHDDSVTAGCADVAQTLAQVRALLARVIRGDGVDVDHTKQILNAARPSWYSEHAVAVDRALRIANKLLSPYAPMPAIQPSNDHTLKNISDALRQELTALPTAKDLYDSSYYCVPVAAHAEHAAARNRLRLVVALAPYLTRSQLQFIVSEHRSVLRPSLVALELSRGLGRMSYVAHLKSSLAQIVDDYGGFSFVPQAHTIAFLLGDTLTRSRQEDRSATTRKYGSALLGPEDMAGLMRAILSAVVQGHTVQRALRLALEMLVEQPRGYVIGVFYEMSVNGSQRLLAGLLMRLCDSSQSCFCRHWDYLTILGNLLQMPMPRRTDYMAGGKYQRRSYYEAVYQIAANIIDDSADYLGLKFWLTANIKTHSLLRPDVGSHRDVNTASPDSLRFHRVLASPRFQGLVQSALTAILHADDAGQKLIARDAAAAAADDDDEVFASDNDNHEEGDVLRQARAEAEACYCRAFAACRALIQHDKRALFRLPWLKAYYERNYEALVVRTVVGNIVDGVDDVRAWLLTQPSAHAAGLTEQELSELIAGVGKHQQPRAVDRLVALVVGAVYFHPADRDRLWSDPLVRLLVVDVATEECRLDFTIVSGMGVITEGCEGQELQASLERLGSEHGVRWVRANTGTARHLEYNARKIADAVQEVRTRQWGWLGYSQGCANQWKAEAVLATGTPTEQRLLDGLACRNLLYSAANGTPHGTCAEWKMSEAAVSLELELKQYQLQVSHNMVTGVLTALQTAFATREVVFLLSGMHSLNHMGAFRGIWWGGVHKPDVPTCAVRAVISPDGYNFPEVLTQLANALTRQERNVPLAVPKSLGPIDGRSHCAGWWVSRCVEGGQPRVSGCTVDELVRAYTTQLQQGDASTSSLSVPSWSNPGLHTPSSAPHAGSDVFGSSLGEAGTDESEVHNLDETPQHDTQVTAFEAQAFPVYVRNTNGIMLQRCAMQNRVHKGHHWAPLTAAETGFITTRGDDVNGVNMGSRDKHLFPWVLVNARFGIIARSPAVEV